jgi:hypothetical protein
MTYKKWCVLHETKGGGSKLKLVIREERRGVIIIIIIIAWPLPLVVLDPHH